MPTLTSLDSSIRATHGFVVKKKKKKKRHIIVKLPSDYLFNCNSISVIIDCMQKGADNQVPQKTKAFEFEHELWSTCYTASVFHMG